MGRFGAIAVGVLALIVMRLYGVVEKCLGVLDIFRDLRQVGKLEWCTVGSYDLHQVYTVEMKLILLNRKFLGREIERLLDKIYVLVHVAHLFLNRDIVYSGQNLH